MKKKRFFGIGKRLLATGMALAVCAPTMMLSAISTSAAETTISYNYAESYTDENTDITYYDICGGESTNRPTSEKEVMKQAITYGDTLENWAKIAYDVIGSNSKNYWGYSSKSFSESWGSSNPACYDMVSELCNDSEGIINGKLGNSSAGSSYRTGIQVGYSLSDAKDAMYNIPVYLRDNKVTAANIQKYSSVPILDDTSNRLVLYDFVGNLQMSSTAYQSHYNVFGLVFYDFEYCPIDDEDAVYFSTPMEEMLTETSKEVASCDGFSIASSTTNGLSVTTLSNNSSQEASMDAGDQETYSQTLGNTFESTTSTTYGQSIGVGVDFKGLGKLDKLQLSANFSFEEMYEQAYGSSEENTKEVTTSSSISYSVPAYSTVSVSKNQSTKAITINYKQGVGIKYKVAVIGICGGFYSGGGMVDVKGYAQNQFSTVFGAVNQNNESNGSTDDAITSLKNRYNTYKNDGNNNAEKKVYTLHTHKDAGDGESKIYTVSNTLDWASVKKQSYDITKVINALDSESHTMSAVSGTMKGEETITEYHGSEPVVTNPLKIIKIHKDSLSRKAVSSEYLTVGGNDLTFTKYTYQGFFEDGETEYPDFDTSKGYWILTDKEGNEIEDSDVAELGNDGGNNQILKAKAAGTVYVKYMITEDEDDGYYYYNASTGSAKQIKNSDLDSVPFITITVYNTSAEAAVASMFSGDNPGAIAVAVVIVLIIAAVIFIVVKKRKKAALEVTAESE